MLIYVTDINKFSNEKVFIENIISASECGVKYLQLRFNNSKDLDSEKISSIIHNKLDNQKTKIIVNGDIDISTNIKSFGFHISSKNKISGEEVKDKTKVSWVSKAVHTEDDIITSNKDDMIDSYILGTLFKSNSHPGGNFIGIEKFKRLIKLTTKPVIAIGGIDEKNANLVHKSGASGIAVISAIAYSKNISTTLDLINNKNDKYIP